MPTAADNEVFARWLRMEWERNDTGDGYDVVVRMIVSVAGEQVATFTTFTLDDGTTFTTQLADAVDAKREEYVSA